MSSFSSSSLYNGELRCHCTSAAWGSNIMFQSRTCGSTTHHQTTTISAVERLQCPLHVFSDGSWGNRYSWYHAVRPGDRMRQLCGVLFTLLFAEVSFIIFILFTKNTFVLNKTLIFVVVVVHLLLCQWHKYLTIYFTQRHTVHLAQNIVYCSCPGQKALCSLFSMNRGVRCCPQLSQKMLIMLKYGFQGHKRFLRLKLSWLVLCWF